MVLRLGYVLAYPQYPALIGDDDMYDDVAWNLATGAGFAGGVGGPSFGNALGPEIAIGPAYPAFLALVYRLAGHNLGAARLAQAVLGSIVVLLCYFLGRDVFDEGVGRLGAVLAALNPALVIYTGMLLSETLFAFLLVLAIWLTIRAGRDQSLGLWGLSGLVTAIAVLLREEALAMVPLVVAVAWICGARRTKTRNVLVFVAVLTMAVAVWTVRNYATFGEFILVSANGGQSLWISTMGWSEWRKAEDPAYQAIAGGLNYVQANRALFREGVRNILADPLRYARFCLRRLVPFWVGSHTTYLRGFSDSFGLYYARGAMGRMAVKLLLLAVHLALLVLAAVGVATALKGGPQPEVLFLLVPVVAIAGVHLLLFATSRYQVPILPFVLLFSAAGLRSGLVLFAPKCEVAIR